MSPVRPHDAFRAVATPPRVRPAALNPAELIEYTRFAAAEVLAGAFPYVDYVEAERWHQRLYRDGRVDLWLISWLPTQSTQLHDHGGSSGAFTVISGELTEAVHRPGGLGAGALADIARSASDSVGFGAHYVHDVRNLSDTPAVSVHAYSPPLTSMNFYDTADDGGPQLLATIATDDPEPTVTHLPVSRPAAA